MSKPDGFQTKEYDNSPGKVPRFFTVISIALIKLFLFYFFFKLHTCSSNASIKNSECLLNIIVIITNVLN